MQSAPASPSTIRQAMSLAHAASLTALQKAAYPPSSALRPASEPPSEAGVTQRPATQVCVDWQPSQAAPPSPQEDTVDPPRHFPSLSQHPLQLLGSHFPQPVSANCMNPKIALTTISRNF